MKVAYLGDEYSYSYLASKKFGADQYVAYPTITAALQAVESEKADACAAPIENSIEGGVHECLDALNVMPLYIHCETSLKIGHKLIVKKGAKLSDIKTVYSHPQALSQCSEFIKRNGFKAVAVDSTSEGLKRVTNTSEGAIARTPREGQEVAAEAIEDYSTNETRFVLIKRKPSFEGSKVSVVFETLNEPGALLKALTVISDFNLNMIKIESRPQKAALGRYIFYVDFLFSGTKETLSEVLDAISRKTVTLKFLGCYDKLTEAI